MTRIHDPWFYVSPIRANASWRDAYPDHPDVQRLAREERRRADDLADWDGEMPSEADWSAANDFYGVDMPSCTGDHTWGRCDRDECDFQRRTPVEAATHQHSGCGHECDSLACYTIAGLKDSQCIRCQLRAPEPHGPSRGMDERKP